MDLKLKLPATNIAEALQISEERQDLLAEKASDIMLKMQIMEQYVFEPFTELAALCQSIEEVAMVFYTYGKLVEKFQMVVG